MIAAGVGLADPALGLHGLSLLAWLVNNETSGGHVSSSPAGGHGFGETPAAFDQQPIE
jgi:hypothetical protein